MDPLVHHALRSLHVLIGGSLITERGAATRARIVYEAAALMARGGVAGTSLDDVRAATSTSKSQLYHYFSDKSDLVRAVIAYQTDAVLAQHDLATQPLDSLAAVLRWRYRIMAAHRAQGFATGCPLGRLAAELADPEAPTDDATRAALAAGFERWHTELTRGLSTMVERKALTPDADPAALATGLLAAVQGGLLLATAMRDPRPLRLALDVAIAQIKRRAVRP